MTTDPSHHLPSTGVYFFGTLPFLLFRELMENHNIPEWTDIGYYIPCFQVYAQIHQERLLIIFLEYAQEFKRPF